MCGVGVDSAMHLLELLRLRGWRDEKTYKKS